MPNSAITPPHSSIALSFCPERAVSIVCAQLLTFAALRDPPVQLWAPSRPCRAQACQGAPAIAEARDSFCEGNQPTETARTGLADSSERAGLEWRPLRKSGRRRRTQAASPWARWRQSSRARLKTGIGPKNHIAISNHTCAGRGNRWSASPVGGGRRAQRAAGGVDLGHAREMPQQEMSQVMYRGRGRAGSRAAAPRAPPSWDRCQTGPEDGTGMKPRFLKFLSFCC